MPSATRSPAGVCLLAVLTCLAGCHRPATTKKLDPESLARYGELPGLRASHHPQLADELARLTSEQATPAQLSSAVTPTSQGGRASEDLGHAMNAIVSHKKVQLTLQRIDKLYPCDAFAFSPIRLQHVLEIRDLFAGPLDQYRQLLAEPHMRFRVDLMQGLLADLSFVDQARFVHRLEALSAADSLAHGSPAEAVFPLRNMLSLDARLGRLQHVVPRLTAARLREEALQVLEAIAQHPRAAQVIHEQLYSVIQEQLNQWPSDAAAWIGDRAQGMHTYELIRDGYLTSIMTWTEIKGLDEDRELLAFMRAATRSIDDDQLYYLKTMRSVIDACVKPYFERKQTLRKLAAELQELADTSRYPIIAARFMFADIDRGHRAQAADRARCEAWALALATAAGQPRPGYDINPLTGEPYQEHNTPGQASVGYIDAMEPTLVVRVPRRRVKATLSDSVR